MKKSKIIITFMLSLFISVSFTQDIKKVKPDQVTIIWRGYKVTGEHKGAINIKEGFLKYKEGFLSGGEFIVDMNSITNIDIEDKVYSKKLVGHLKSDDFFGVENYPLSKIVFKKVNRSKSGYTVEADLTIKEDTHPVVFSIEQNDVGESTVYDAKIIVDRSKYNVRYGSSSFFDSLGDKVIYDDFELYIKVII